MSAKGPGGGSRLPLLVSSVNGGGVFLVDGHSVEQLSRIDTTGLATLRGGLAWARQSQDLAELRVVRDGTVTRICMAAASLDLHDVLWHGEHIYVVATELNAVVRLDAETFAESGRWTCAGETDSQHVNSVCVHDGRVLATRFGEFETHRGYKEQTVGSGQVFDVETGEILISGLSQPHSLKSFDGLLWVCDSQAQKLRAYRDFESEVEVDLGAYARGLAFDAGCVQVGLSRGRNDPDSDIASARIVVLDRDHFQVRDTIELPFDEVYDLLPVEMPLAQLREAALSEAFAEIGSLREAVDRGSGCVRATHDHAAGLEVALHTATARGDSFVAHAGELAAALDAARSSGADAQARVEEAAIWTGLLEAEVARLHGIVASHERVLSRQHALLDLLGDAVVARERYIDGLVTSRSWRWTRRLRRIELERPAGLLVVEGDADLVGGVRTDDGAAGPAPDPHAVTPGSLAALRAFAQSEFVPVDWNLAPRRSMVPIRGLAFAVHESPEISIVVTAYGNFDQTFECLRSIRRAGALSTFEVIVIEDASGDDEMGRFASVPGLRFLQNAENLGFLRSANQAVALSSGAFIHLLNNDTRVEAGWLDALVGTFYTFDDCGMVGSLLVYPDGTVQEAGGIVWNDGDACNHGRGGDPRDPRYATVREVDYVSGASLLIRSALLRDLGGFDERYLPAYYEDTDLAFRVREHGYRVYVQPRSIVEHLEGLSHGTDIDTGIKASQASNRLKFLERWRDTLQRDQLAPGEHVFLARDRSQRKKTALVIDRYAPRTDRDAGSRAIWQLMRVLSLQGMSIKFWPHEADDDAEYAPMLLSHGIEIVRYGTHDGEFDEWVAANGRYVDAVILSRPMVAIDYIASVRAHCTAPLLFYGHDVHHLRFLAQHRLEPGRQLDGAAHHSRLIEEAVWRHSDLILYPAQTETSYVRNWLHDNSVAARAETIPLFAYELGDEEIGAGLSDRRLVLFVGGFAHAPNADGAAWFVREVWPTIRHHHPDYVLCIVGADPPAEIISLRTTDIWVTGHISEAGLRDYYRSARVVVAPLRFGAGVKGKVIEAMRCGVPCVTTSIGAQGLVDANFLRVADEAADFARLVIDLIRLDDEWMHAATRGYDYVRRHFSVDAVWKILSSKIDAAPYASVEALRRRLETSKDARAGEGDPSSLI